MPKRELIEKAWRKGGRLTKDNGNTEDWRRRKKKT
jgi:hypothetical protein